MAISRNRKKFADWCLDQLAQFRAVPDGTEQTIQTNKSSREATAHVARFKEELRGFPAGTNAQLLLMHEWVADGECVIDLPTTNASPLQTLSINCGFGRPALVLAHMHIRRCVIGTNAPIPNFLVTVRGCEVAELEIGNTVAVDIQDSQIGRLKLGTNGKIGALAIKNSSILDFVTPTAGESNPFSAGVTIGRDVWMPTTTRGMMLSDAQTYRNVRHHLRAIDNSHAADFFHALEMRTEREHDSFGNILISYLYEWFSNFGGSYVRPIILLVCLSLITFSIVFATGGAVLGYDQSSSVYSGWRSYLLSGDNVQAWRAAYIAIESALNPVGLFNSRPLVLANSGASAIWVAVARVLSVVLVTLSVLAIRRRFRMQSSG